MSDSLDHFFTQLRTVAQTSELAEPGEIRSAGRRRTNVRRGIVAAAVAVLVGAGGLAAYGAGLGRGPSVGPEPGASSTAPGPTGSPSALPSASPTGSPTGSVVSTPPAAGVPPRAAGADCRPADLDPRPYYGADGAMGSAYQTVVVQNVSPTRCRLYGHPTVLFKDPATGHSGTVPTQRDGTATPVMLALGGWAKMTFVTTNGNPFGPGAPECAHPGSYQGLSLVIGDGLAFKLPGFSVSWECADLRILAWSPASGSADAGANVHRAPAP